MSPRAEAFPIEKMPRLYRLLHDRDRAEVLGGMDPAEIEALEHDWSMNCLPYQEMPDGDWSVWMLLGGRGIGKTLTTSHIAHEVAKEPDRLDKGIIGILGRTFNDTVATNIEADATGILATAPPGFCPRWQPGKALLTWPNGVKGRVFAAEAPESGRGPNLAFLIADETAAWRNGQEVWDTFQMGLRVGRAQAVMSTTPKPLAWLRKIADDEGTVIRRASTYDNPYLARKQLAKYKRQYVGTRLERQELGGFFIDDIAGALIRGNEIERNRVATAPDLLRVIVCVDPAIYAGKRSDYTGIVVLGLGRTVGQFGGAHVFVLEDATGKYEISNNAWAERAVGLARKWKAEYVVCEKNRGGDMVEFGIRSAAGRHPVKYRHVTAIKGKLNRGQPVGALYEQNEVHHVGVFPDLELELQTWVEGDPSPNRMDALVHGVTFLRLADDSSVVHPPHAILGFS